MYPRGVIALIFYVIFLFPGTDLLAGNSAGGAWAGFYISGSLHRDDKGPWRYGFYGDTRYQDRGNGINQYVLLPAVGYRINSKVTFWGGYTYFRSVKENGPAVNENRLFQQVSWKINRWQHTNISSRTRLEQRSRHEVDDIDFRLRQQFRLEHRFAANMNLKYIVADEFFYHMRDTDWTREGWGQNRFYTGLGWDRHYVRVELLYMHQTYRARNRTNPVNHLLLAILKW